MKLGRCARLLVLSGALSTASGCLSMGSVQTASTLGKGNFQISAEPGIYGPNVGKGTGGGSGAAAQQDPVPHFDVAFRYGVSDRFDLGVRSGWSLLEVQTKFLFTPPDAETLAISVAPGLGMGLRAVGGATVTYFNLAVPVLFGIKHFRANELVFGPRFNNMLFALGDTTGSATVYVFAVGGSIGYQFAIGDIFKMLPELAINVPLFASSKAGAAEIAGAGFGGVIWQLKVGLMFGRSGKKREEPPVEIGPPPPMPAPEPLPRAPEPPPVAPILESTPGL